MARSLDLENHVRLALKGVNSKRHSLGAKYNKHAGRAATWAPAASKASKPAVVPHTARSHHHPQGDRRGGPNSERSKLKEKSPKRSHHHPLGDRRGPDGMRRYAHSEGTQPGGKLPPLRWVDPDEAGHSWTRVCLRADKRFRDSTGDDGSDSDGEV